jgi:isocitrate dehydrogenase
MRALEAELDWTFPAIKKQVDSLHQSEVIEIDKSGSKRSIIIKKDFQNIVRQIFIYALQKDIKNLFEKHKNKIETCYPGKAFGCEIEPDLVLVHNNCSKDELESIKKEVSKLFGTYFINMVYITCLSSTEREQRYRLADRFVLSIMRQTKAWN